MTAVNKYLVLDIETEGLNPKTDCILEVGAIAITDQLDNVAEFSEIAVGRPRGQLSEFIKNMHGKNGLLDECDVAVLNHRKGGMLPTEATLDAGLAVWILQQGYQSGQVVLAGNSVHFDHAFIKARMPLTAALLHYRVKDIGATQRELVDMAVDAGYPTYFDMLQPEMPHRGLADAKLELEEWRNQRKKMRQLFTHYRPWS
jgi:oligoribonuclease (3'-5' exoribonuclease)